jgi:hypothetical protein
MIEHVAPYFIAFIILCIIAEAVYSSIKKQGLYEVKDTWTSIFFGVLGVVTRILIKGANLRHSKIGDPRMGAQYPISSPGSPCGQPKIHKQKLWQCADHLRSPLQYF